MLEDGEFVTVVIREKAEERRLVMPQAALQIDQSGYYAMIVDKTTENSSLALLKRDGETIRETVFGGFWAVAK